jgi:hypothetical protein
MKQARWVLGGALVAGLLAGCSSGSDSAGSASASATVATSSAPDQPLDLCRLMPVGEVAALLQANGADTVTEQKPGAGGMCSYLHVPTPGDYRTKLLIDFTRMASSEQAQAALAAHRRDFTDRGIAVIPVPGLGDEAFVAEAEGNEGLKMRVGAYQGQINLQVDERPPASLRPAVLALGKQVVARLPGH